MFSSTKKKHFLVVLLSFFSFFSYSQEPYINEVDSDTSGSDTKEFIELKWIPNTSLDGYVVVLFNGSDDKSYNNPFDLTGFSTDANGFFILGNTDAGNVDITISNNGLQNGADAVAIFKAPAEGFPNDTDVTSVNLIDAIIYDTNDDDDSGLLAGLAKAMQFNEDENSDKDNQSIQRLADGSYTISNTTFRAENIAAEPCTVNLFNFNVSCNTVTSGEDTYSTTIDFSGARNGITYTLNSDVGIIGGDHPSDTETGTITISGVTEGTTITLTLVEENGSSCSFSKRITSPNCIGLPITETFDYTSLEILTANASWLSINTGDDILLTDGNLSYDSLKASSGNSIVFDGSGAEAYTTFTDVTSGVVYASFLLNVNALQSNPDLTDGGYFASLANTTTSYDARLWVRPISGEANETAYDIGFGIESSNPTKTTTTYQVGQTLFVVISYNLENGEANLWVNPSSSSFESIAIPTSTITSTEAEQDDIASAIGLFILRQGSGSETPTIQIDELRIASSWKEVTPKDVTASINENTIEVFSIFPNPVSDDQFTIGFASNETKQVSIFNILGKQVFATSFAGTSKTLQVGSLSSGVYLLKITEKGKVITKKLIIK